MEPIYATITTLTITALGWLSYHQPLFALKILFAFFLILGLFHLGTQIYRSAWLECQSFIKQDISSIHPKTKTKKRQIKKTKAILRPIFTRSTRRINVFTKKCNEKFIVSYLVLFCLGVFCLIRKWLMPQGPSAIGV